MTHHEAASTEASHKKYELMFIFQPELLESAVEKKLKEFEAFFEENHAKVLMRDNLGKRKLAYRIAKHDSGIYIVYNLEMPGDFNKELDEHLRIDKDVIRHMVISVSEDYEYQKFAEEAPVTKPEMADKEKPKSTATHKANTGVKKSEVKDKGKKADAESLDKKLDSILEGDDLNV